MIIFVSDKLEEVIERVIKILSDLKKNCCFRSKGLCKLNLTTILNTQKIIFPPIYFKFYTFDAYIPLYRFRNAGRGKSGQRRVPHHLTDGISPKEEYSIVSQKITAFG
jgi:hypothetical protein